MVMEFASLGSLYTYLNNNITWKERITALLDISIGLNTLHNNDLIHQDFHPGNLLFNNYINYNNSNEINNQFNEAEKYRKSKLLIFENNTHPQAIYTS